MQDSAPNAGDVGQAMKDKMFLRKAAEGGIAEVKFGELAAQKGSSDDVKAFGQKMVVDHGKLNASMAQIADSMGVRLPTALAKDDQAEFDKLSGLSGNDFDTEYLTLMVKDHHKDLHEFRMEAASTTDPTLQQAVGDAQKVIRDHTMMVDKLAREKGIPMPTRPDHPTPSPSS
jgi:putative membrane protein